MEIPNVNGALNSTLNNNYTEKESVGTSALQDLMKFMVLSARGLRDRAIEQLSSSEMGNLHKLPLDILKINS